MTKLFFATAAALTVLAATSAQAEPHQLVMVSRTLTYQTQDIATPTGAARMLSRIDFIARGLCAPSSQVAPHADAAARLCRAQAVARAVDTLAAPLVTAAYSARQAGVSVASRRASPPTSSLETPT